MKILIIAQVPPPFHGSNVMATILRDALVQLGHNVTFIDKSFSNKMSEVRKPSFRKLLRVPVLMAMLVRHAYANRKHAQICIYFISIGPLAFLVDALMLKILRLARIPYILRFGAKGFCSLSNRGRFWESMTALSFTGCVGGIVKAEKLKADVNKYISDEHLIAIPNCISDDRISIALKIDDSIIQVLFLSNLMPAKGPLQFLRAAKIVVKTTTNVRFVLAGAKWRDEFHFELLNYIKDNGLGKFVEVPGGVYGKNKNVLFESSHIFVFPTQNETFGIVILEAMRAGIPVIASKEGAIPETVVDKITGFIINPNDPDEIADRILMLIEHPDLRKRMGLLGKERFKKRYTTESYRKNWKLALLFFERILSQKNEST